MPRGVRIGRNYYHVTVISGEPKNRKWGTDEIGRKGHSKRVSFKRRDGKWMTAKYLISKKDSLFKSEENTFYVWDEKVENLLRNIKTRNNMKYHVVKSKRRSV